MKNRIFTLLVSLLCISSHSQNFRFEHSGSRAALIKKEKLKNAKNVSDVVSAYSNFWNTQINLLSMELIGTCDGKTVQAKNRTDSFNLEQKNILSSADFNTVILIKLKFNFKELVTDIKTPKIEELEFAISPAPEVEAEFLGGFLPMTKYFEETIFSKVSEKFSLAKISKIAIAFTINEKGQVVSPQIYRSSLDRELDQLLLDAVRKMPNWKAAENSKGEKIKQKFVFGIGSEGC